MLDELRREGLRLRRTVREVRPFLGRLRPFFLGVLSFLVLAFGALGYLHYLSLKDREAVQSFFDTRRQGLEAYARAALETSLKEQLESNRRALRDAEKDALKPAEGLYLRDHGKQVLPRLADHVAGEKTPAKQLYEQLVAGVARGRGERGEQLARVLAVREAMARDDSLAVDKALGELSRLRRREILSASVDVPILLATLESLTLRDMSQPALELELARFTRRGILLDKLQRRLLDARARFTSKDFEFLHDRVATLSQRLGAGMEDFQAQLEGLAAEPVPLSEEPTSPVLLRSGWYLEPQGGERVEGVAVDVSYQRQRLEKHLRESGLLEHEAQVLLGDAAQLRLETLPLKLQVTAWDEAEARLEGSYQVRTWVLIWCGLLLVAGSTMVLVNQYSKLRFMEDKSVFVSQAAHELRTPVQGIIWSVDNIQRKLEKDRDPRARLQGLRSSATTLLELADRLKLIDSMDSGSWKPQRKKVRLDALVSRLRKELRSSGQRSVELTADVGDTMLFVDPTLMKLVLFNLAANACRYNRNKPVRLKIAASGGRVHFTDNGIGIDEKDWERIFEQFVRLPDFKDKVSGSGLGLNLCHRIMREHEGDIRVLKSSPSEGTTFELTFPAGVMT